MFGSLLIFQGSRAKGSGWNEWRSNKELQEERQEWRKEREHVLEKIGLHRRRQRLAPT